MPPDNLTSQSGSEPLLRVFVHIPKTGGQTVRRMIIRRHGKSAYFLLGPYRPDADRPKPVTTRSSINSLLALEPPAREGIKLVGGHVQAGAIPHLPGRPRCFVLIREPIKRLVSLYRHAQRKAKHSLALDVEGMSLEEFAGSSITRQIDNDQTRRLAGVSEMGLEGDLPEDDASLLTRARENLARWFDVAGTTERSDESLLLLSAAWGWGLPWYERVNVAKPEQASQAPSARAIGLLRERNALDLTLHAEVTAALNQRIVQGGRRFRQRLALFRAANPFYGIGMVGMDWFWRRAAAKSRQPAPDQ